MLREKERERALRKLQFHTYRSPVWKLAGNGNFTPALRARVEIFPEASGALGVSRRNDRRNRKENALSDRPTDRREGRGTHNAEENRETGIAIDREAGRTFVFATARYPRTMHETHFVFFCIRHLCGWWRRQRRRSKFTA